MSFAVIKTGGKQYKVAEGDILNIEKIDMPIGSEFDFDSVLLYVNAQPENTKIGTPIIDGAKVHARIVDQFKDDKKIVFKFKNKTRYKKKKGHRQPLSKIEILKITP